MLRLTPRTILRTPFSVRLLSTTPKFLSDSPSGGSENSGPGWGGRPGSDHALHRDGNDAQSAPSKEARQDKADGKEGSGAISQKDERNANQRAKDDHPEAPGPVIGMNSERGGKH